MCVVYSAPAIISTTTAAQVTNPPTEQGGNLPFELAAAGGGDTTLLTTTRAAVVSPNSRATNTDQDVESYQVELAEALAAVVLGDTSNEISEGIGVNSSGNKNNDFVVNIIDDDKIDIDETGLVDALAGVALGEADNNKDDSQSNQNDFQKSIDDGTRDHLHSLEAEPDQNATSDVLFWSPLDSEDLAGTTNYDYLFTDEELVEALRFINDNNDDEDLPDTTTTTETGALGGEVEGETENAPLDFASLSRACFDNWTANYPVADDTEPLPNLNEAALLQDPILPGLQFRDKNDDSDDDEDSALLPQHLHQIFGEDEPYILEETENEYQGPQQLTTATSSTGESQEQDLKPLDILEQLQGLSSSLPPLEPSNDDDSSSDIPPLQDLERTIATEDEEQRKHRKEQLQLELLFGGDDVAPYLFCQTCDTDFRAPDIESDIPPSQEIERSASTEDEEQRKHQKEQLQLQLLLGGDDVAPLYCSPCDTNPPAPDTHSTLSLLPADLGGPLDENDPLYLSDIDTMMADLGISTDTGQEDETPTDHQPTNSGELDHQISLDIPPIASPAVLAAAQPFLETFGVKPTVYREPPGPEPSPSSKSLLRDKKGERSCLGHRERILCVRFSSSGSFMSTASADATIRIWRPANNQLLCTLSHHNSNYECLRVAWSSPEWYKETVPNNDKKKDTERPDPDANALLATGGADGQVFVLRRKPTSPREEWEVMACIDHSQNLRHFEPTDVDDRPQIYALQFIDNWQVHAGCPSSSNNNRVLLTSSENHIHVWELIQEPKRQDGIGTVMEGDEEDEELSEKDDQEDRKEYPWHFREVFSIGFGDLQSMGYGVSVGRVTEQASPTLPYTNTTGSGGGEAFGGERNPTGVIFVFDAAYCPTNGLLGVALSDGSLRLLNGRGICVSVLQLPGVSTHLTSFCWDTTGTQLATSVAATGHLVTWEILLNRAGTEVQKTACSAILGGGHDRTVYGMLYCGKTTENGNQEQDALLLSWGGDGRVVLWDAKATGEVDVPIATLFNNPDYPVYGLDFDERSRYLALVGGSGDGGFIGIPVRLYDVFPESRLKTPNHRKDEKVDAAREEDALKKLRLDNNQ